MTGAKGYNFKERYLLGFLLLFVLLSRALTFESSIYSYDSANFALAAESYSIQDTRPHLPGYFLYVESIKSVNELLGNIHSSMLFLSLIYSLFAAAITYFVVRRWFDKSLSFSIVLAVATNPMAWYYGSVSEIYAFDWFFSSLVLFTFYSKKDVFLAPVVFAAGLGIRPSSGVLLLPLYLLLWYYYLKDNKSKTGAFYFSHLTGLAVLLIWLIPMINSAGGAREYIRLYATNSPLPEITPLQNLFQFSSYSIYIVFPFMLPLTEILLKKRLRPALKNIRKSGRLLIIIFVSIIPPLLFFLFFHYAKGYALLIFPALFIFLGLIIRSAGVKYHSLRIAIFLQITFFLFFPRRGYSPETAIAPASRSEGIMELWLDRTFGDHLLAFSQIDYQSKIMEEFDILLDKLDQGSEPENSAKLLLDPTVSNYSRALQFNHPEFYFYRFDARGKGKFLVYHNLEITLMGKTDLSAMIVISRKDFIPYLKELNRREIAETESLTAYRVGPREAENLAEKYYDLFIR